jgi:hypothetical protein
MTTNGDDAKRDLKLRAWQMATQEQPRKSLRNIAAELGIGLATASRYVQEVEQAGEFIDLLDNAEARVAQAMRFREYIQLLRARIDQGAKAEAVLPVSMRVEDSLAKLHGTYMPAKVAISDDRDAAQVDPELLAAVREAQRRAAAERREVGAPAAEGGDES